MAIYKLTEEEMNLVLPWTRTKWVVDHRWNQGSTQTNTYQVPESAMAQFKRSMERRDEIITEMHLRTGGYSWEVVTETRIIDDSLGEDKDWGIVTQTQDHNIDTVYTTGSGRAIAYMEDVDFAGGGCEQAEIEHHTKQCEAILGDLSVKRPLIMDPTPTPPTINEWVCSFCDCINNLNRCHNCDSPRK